MKTKMRWHSRFSVWDVSEDEAVISFLISKKYIVFRLNAISFVSIQVSCRSEMSENFCSGESVRGADA